MMSISPTIHFSHWRSLSILTNRSSQILGCHDDVVFGCLGATDRALHAHRATRRTAILFWVRLGINIRRAQFFYLFVCVCVCVWFTSCLISNPMYSFFSLFLQNKRSTIASLTFIRESALGYNTPFGTRFDYHGMNILLDLCLSPLRLVQFPLHSLILIFVNAELTLYARTCLRIQATFGACWYACVPLGPPRIAVSGPFWTIARASRPNNPPLLRQRQLVPMRKNRKISAEASNRQLAARKNSKSVDIYSWCAGVHHASVHG